MLSNIKYYLRIVIGIIILGLLIGLWSQYSRAKKYEQLYDRELQNVAAYQISNSGLEGEVRQYKMTIDELYDSKDSLDRKLIVVMQELNIANKQVKNLQYQLSQANKIDTIRISDTIFVPNVDIDTTIGDKWYNLRLQMQYPSTVITEPTFNSEQYVYIYNKKEYVGGKSKCFFINWFKKKYIVTEVKIEEENPYIKTLNQKFIEVDGQ